MSSFRHCAAISYDDFLKASGSSSRIIDLSCMEFMDILQSAQAAIAQRLGCSQADICWVVQTHYEVAPGVPLSYSSSLSSPECVASLVLHSIFAQLEVAVLSAESESDASQRFPPLFRMSTPAAATSAESTGDPEPISKFPRREAPRVHTSSAASARTVDASRTHEDHACELLDDLRLGGSVGPDGAVPRGDAGDMKAFMHEVDSLPLDEWLEDVFAGDAAMCREDMRIGGRCVDAVVEGGEGGNDTAYASEPLFVRCGVDGVADGRMAVRAVMQQIVRSITQHSAADGETITELIRCCGNIAADVVAEFDAGSTAGAADGAVEGGVSGSAGAAENAHASARSNGSSQPQHECERAGEIAPIPQPMPPGVVRGAEAVAAGVEQFQVQCCVDGKEDTVAGVSHRAEDNSHGDGEDEGDDDGSGEQDDAASDAYHETVTRTLCAMLRAVRDVCYEVSETWPTVAQAAEAPVPAAEAEELRQERVHLTLSEICTTHAMSTRDAGRMTRGMAVNNMSNSRKQFEVENAHIRYYRQLALSAEQRAQMAAWWHSWLRNKGTLDTSAAAARRALNALPDTLPLPQSHLSHICHVAEGAMPPRTCAACAAATLCASPGPCSCTHGMHEQHACHAAASESGAVGMHVAGVQVASGCAGCGGSVGDDAGGVPLGADAGGMCRAAEAVRLLRGMQDADGALSVSAAVMHQQPGALLDADQLAYICRKNVLQGCPMIDSLVLCQLAATQLRRQELYRWPAMLGAPLPERM